MALSLAPYINGKSYEYADIIINLLGAPFTSAQSIEYSINQEMENVYGAGNKPVSFGYGNFKPEAKITLLMEEVEALQSVAPGGALQRIPNFDVTVFYFDASLTPRTHTLKSCRIKNNTRKSSQGETSISCELELLVGDILFV